MHNRAHITVYHKYPEAAFSLHRKLLREAQCHAAEFAKLQNHHTKMALIKKLCLTTRLGCIQQNI